MAELEMFLEKQGNKTIAVTVYDFEKEGEILINTDKLFHPASTIKVHVMIEVFHQAEQGIFSLEDCLPS